MKTKNKRSRIIFLIILLSILLVLLFYLRFYNTAPSIIDYKYSKKYNEDKTLNVTLKLKTYNKNKIYCKFISDEDSGLG